MENRFPFIIKLLSVSILTALLIAACQGQTRTEFLMEVTREVTREVTVVVTVIPDEFVTGAENATEGAQVQQPTAIPATNTPVAPDGPTATPDPRPTPVNAEIIVAEQAFERGRMFYVQPVDEIWVLYGEPDSVSGEWERYPDTWDESQAELDPDLQPPAEGLLQPIRGFGKVWRDNETVQNRLGWGVSPESGHVTLYQYFAGGEVDDGEYIPGPGTHTINSNAGNLTFIFDEATETWSIAAASAGNP